MPPSTQAPPPSTQATPATGKRALGFSADRKAIQDKQRGLKDILLKAYGSYGGHAFRDIMTPDEVAADVSKAIGADTKEFVVVIDFYTTLIKCLDASARLPKAMIYGAVSADALAGMTRKDLRALVHRFDEMDETEFQKEIAKGIQKTSVRLPRHDDSDRHNSDDDGSNKSDKIN
jgi:hypothetical protein